MDLLKDGGGGGGGSPVSTAQQAKLPRMSIREAEQRLEVFMAQMTRPLEHYDEAFAKTYRPETSLVEAYQRSFITFLKNHYVITND